MRIGAPAVGRSARFTQERPSRESGAEVTGCVRPGCTARPTCRKTPTAGVGPAFRELPTRHPCHHAGALDLESARPYASMRLSEIVAAFLGSRSHGPSINGRSNGQSIHRGQSTVVTRRGGTVLYTIVLSEFLNANGPAGAACASSYALLHTGARGPARP